MAFAAWRLLSRRGYLLMGNSSAIVRASKPLSLDSALHTVVEDLRLQVTGIAVRNAHAKGYGLARGELRSSASSA
jgi:hypothetical protein